jgi:hypothetical protein
LSLTDPTERRKVVVELDASRVFGWAPVCGDLAAGFGTCSQMVLGARVVVQLLPGEGMLVKTTLFRNS